MKLPQPTELPRLWGYGFLGDEPLPSIEVDIEPPLDPERAIRERESLVKPLVIPDVTRARFGAGDPAMVGALLKTANGMESGLVGVPPSIAQRYLTSWGYPTTMDAWDAATWEQHIAAHSLDPSPLPMLEPPDSQRYSGY